jgi:serine/threonine protein phosphatase PrpC
MEDRHLILPGGSPSSSSTAAPTVVGVFDGHRGSEAAEFMATHLAAELARQWGVAAGPADALRSAFVNIDAQFVAEQVTIRPMLYSE